MPAMSENSTKTVTMPTCRSKRQRNSWRGRSVAVRDTYKGIVPELSRRISATRACPLDERQRSLSEIPAEDRDRIRAEPVVEDAGVNGAEVRFERDVVAAVL